MVKELLLGLASLGMAVTPKGYNPSTPPDGSIVYPNWEADATIQMPFSAQAGNGSLAPGISFGFADFGFGLLSGGDMALVNSSVQLYYPARNMPSALPDAMGAYYKLPSWISRNVGPYYTYTDGILTSYIFGAPFTSNDYQDYLSWTSSSAAILNSISIRCYFLINRSGTERVTSIAYWFTCSNQTMAKLNSNRLFVQGGFQERIGTSTAPFMVIPGVVPSFSGFDGVELADTINNDEINLSRINPVLGFNFPTGPVEVGTGFNPIFNDYQQSQLKNFYQSSTYQQMGWVGSCGRLSMDLIPAGTSSLSLRCNIGLIEMEGTGTGLPNTNYNDGYNAGFQNGKDVGYTDGFKEGASSVETTSSFSWLTSALNSVTGIFGLQLFPGFSLGSLVMIPLAGGVLLWVIKLLRG